MIHLLRLICRKRERDDKQVRERPPLYATAARNTTSPTWLGAKK